MYETHTVVGETPRLLLRNNRKPATRQSFQWVFYLAVSFYFSGILLRSIISFRDSPELLPVLGILALWLMLFISETSISSRWSGYSPLYIALQTGLIFVLVSTPGYPDFFAGLFVILSMQAMLRLGLRIWAVWIGFWTLALTVLWVKAYRTEALALVLLYTAGNVFYGFYTLATRRAQAVQMQNQGLAEKLQAANHELQAYSARMEQLSVARERNRLARDLHDSVTQTVFSMTLAIQSAALLLERDPPRAEAQLDRLSQLARDALSEMQVLISELKPEEAGKEGLAATLEKHLAGGRFAEKLSVKLEVQGEQSLGLAEQQALFHIIVEALNNTLKHAQTSTARVRLHLTEPLWVEIEDWGQGFDLQRAQRSGRVGLPGMRERAAEVGWEVQIRTSPGAGTCVRVERLPEEVRQK